MYVKSSAAVVAFSCKPKAGSEWGVGWNYLQILAATFDKVTLYVRDAENQIPSINQELSRENINNVTVKPISDAFFYGLFRKPSVHARFLTLYYCLWLCKAFGFLILDRSWRQHNYLFHTTWVSDWIYSPLFLLPFNHKVLGPLGSQPSNFNEKSSDYRASFLRLILKIFLRNFSPNFLSALSADAAIGISSGSLKSFPWSLCRRTRVISPVHCELKWDAPRKSQRQLLFIGKNFPFKNQDLFLDIAVEMLKRDSGLQVFLLGDDLQQAGSINYLQRTNLDKHPRVQSIGLVPHQLVAEYLGGKRSILLQTSSEVGGTVGVEAISLGAPVICVRGHGLDALFGQESYPLAVPYHNHAQFVAAATDLITSVFNNYETHSRTVLELSHGFSLEASQRLFKELIDDI